MRIALDAMGTDSAPHAEVIGALEALAELDPDVEVLLVGHEGAIREELSRHGGPPDRLGIVHAEEVVTPHDPPASVLRKKPKSSMAVGLRMQREGAADAFVSAGSTGAVMACSLFTLRPLPGVDRPPVGAVLPTAQGLCLLVDAGANVGCKPGHLLQFAQLGSVYAQRAMGKAEPSVGLLNIGEEPGKGDELSIAAYDLLADQEGVRFIGNIEGRDIVTGACDVIVCDGFVGNILLKFYESVSGYIVELLKEELVQSSADPAHFDHVFRVLDYAEYGGAPLLGLGGVSIICHGGSSPKAIRNALGVAERSVRFGLVEHSAHGIATTAPETASPAP